MYASALFAALRSGACRLGHPLLADLQTLARPVVAALGPTASARSSTVVPPFAPVRNASQAEPIPSPPTTTQPQGWFSNSRTPTFYDDSIEKWAGMPSEKVSLREMVAFGARARDQPRLALKSASFLLKELPIRLASRLLDLHFLPYIVVTNPHIKKVYDAYYSAFHTLRKERVRNINENAQFVSLLKRLVGEHGPLLVALGRGLRECRSKPLVGDNISLDKFLDSMLRSRISRRVLAEQHIMLNAQRHGYIGIICMRLSVRDAVTESIGRVSRMCERTFGLAPPFHIDSGTDVHITYIPAHLDYMLDELLKNASRAVIETHSHCMSDRLPPIVIQICEGGDELTIKVCDRGGGISRGNVEKVWQYGFSTVGGGNEMDDEEESSSLQGHIKSRDSYSSIGTRALMRELEGVDNAPLLKAPRTLPDAAPFLMGAQVAESGGSPMAGLGFGLPLSRLYAQYLGGDLRLVNMPGYGVDCFIRIRLNYLNVHDVYV